MKTISLISLLLLVFSCSLNSEQEAELSKSIRLYVDALNEDDVIEITAKTHPNVLQFYLDQGDAVFIDVFDASSRPYYLQNGLLKESESHDGNIHVKYEYEGVSKFNFDDAFKQVYIMGLSKDDGKTWYFMTEEEYNDPSIFDTKYKLL